MDVEVVDDPAAKASILNRQLAHFEPGGSPRVPVDALGADRRVLPGIRGLRLTVTGVRAKFKYGGNKSVEQRLEIASALASRGGPMDGAARRRLLDRLPGDAVGPTGGAVGPGGAVDVASPGVPTGGGTPGDATG